MIGLHTTGLGLGLGLDPKLKLGVSVDLEVLDANVVVALTDVSMTSPWAWFMPAAKPAVGQSRISCAIQRSCDRARSSG
ncbi:MAG: hypothetical protein O7F76_01680 [Planctomycetota bacterium]|nr:hypothetical protein [Planctomycetota bacterium]MCZ6815389.1 hypothetical protein [Planctomycetota bacterium]